MESQAPTSQNEKTVHVETWGCQMNVADSERMLSLLASRDYRMTDRAEDADLVLLNTCHIREKARHKVLSRLGVLAGLKRERPNMKIAVAGCVAQADGQKLLQQAPQIDVLFGPGQIDRLPELLDEHEQTGRSTKALGFTKKKPSDAVTGAEAISEPAPTVTGKNETSRYVNIQAGCNNFCTFCVVPHTRGREISRKPEDILKECGGLLASGAREITVLGQNVNSYGLDLVDNGLLPASEDGPFVDLLRRITQLEGLERLRFTSSNPHDFTPALARLFAEHPEMGRYMHLPVQSGNDEVLKRMRRKVTAAQFRERVRWLREAVADMAISTDLIVGFPGETEEQFEDTLRLVEESQFSFIFSFKYSPRKNTAAARFKDQLPEEVKEQRLHKLNELQDGITIAQNKAEIGRTRPVLFLYESKKSPGVYYGRTEHFRLVRVESGRNIVGQCLPVDIKNANKTALAGDLA